LRNQKIKSSTACLTHARVLLIAAPLAALDGDVLLLAALFSLAGFTWHCEVLNVFQLFKGDSYLESALLANKYFLAEEMC
jgi:hypothetical protein